MNTLRGEKTVSLLLRREGMIVATSGLIDVAFTEADFWRQCQALKTPKSIAPAAPIEDKRLNLRARVYQLTGEFLGSRPIDDFDVEEAFEAIVQDPMVSETVASLREAGEEDFIVSSTKSLIRQNLQQSRDEHGLREYLAIPQGDGSYRWKFFKHMEEPELRAVLEEREKEIRELEREADILRAFHDRLSQEARGIKVGDIYHGVVLRLEREEWFRGAA